MDALRWILLGIAVVIIVAIYFFSRTRTKEQQPSPLDAANDVPSFSAEKQPDNEWVDGVGPVRVLDQDESAHQGLNNIRNDLNRTQAPDWDSLYEKPVAERPVAEHPGTADQHESPQADAENSPSKISDDSNKSSSVEAEPESEPLVEPAQSESEKDPQSEDLSSGPAVSSTDYPATAADGPAIDDVISVYVLASDEQPVITGDKILSASYALNLEYGEMKIFHRHSDSPSHEILFSMANILNPGWFELDKMNELKTRGMSFFMQANLVDHPARVLDDMLICAHQMSTMLGGVLCNAQRIPLDEAYTKTLRDKVKQLEKLKAQSI